MRDAIYEWDFRFICTPRVAKHRVFVWLDVEVLPDSATVAIARDDDYFFGVLHSKLHEVWSLHMGTWLGKGNDPRYTPTTTFETFPFPWSPGHEDRSHPAHAAISAAAKQLHEERHAWLNPHLRPPVSTRRPPSPTRREAELGNDELATGNKSPSLNTKRDAELGTGEPAKVGEKPLPLDGGGVWGGGEKQLKDRTLTNLYNALQVWRKKDRMKTKAAAANFAPRLWTSCIVRWTMPSVMPMAGNTRFCKTKKKYCAACWR